MTLYVMNSTSWILNFFLRISVKISLLPQSEISEVLSVLVYCYLTINVLGLFFCHIRFLFELSGVFVYKINLSKLVRLKDRPLLMTSFWNQLSLYWPLWYSFESRLFRRDTFTISFKKIVFFLLWSTLEPFFIEVYTL